MMDLVPSLGIQRREGSLWLGAPEAQLYGGSTELLGMATSGVHERVGVAEPTVRTAR